MWLTYVLWWLSTEKMWLFCEPITRFTKTEFIAVAANATTKCESCELNANLRFCISFLIFSAVHATDRSYSRVRNGVIMLFFVIISCHRTSAFRDLVPKCHFIKHVAVDISPTLHMHHAGTHFKLKSHRLKSHRLKSHFVREFSFRCRFFPFSHGDMFFFAWFISFPVSAGNNPDFHRKWSTFDDELAISIRWLWNSKQYHIWTVGVDGLKKAAKCIWCVTLAEIIKNKRRKMACAHARTKIVELRNSRGNDENWITSY